MGLQSLRRRWRHLPLHKGGCSSYFNGMGLTPFRLLPLAKSTSPQGEVIPSAVCGGTPHPSASQTPSPQGEGYVLRKSFFGYRRTTVGNGLDRSVSNGMGLQSLRHFLRKCHLPLHKGGIALRVTCNPSSVFCLRQNPPSPLGRLITSAEGGG